MRHERPEQPSKSPVNGGGIAAEDALLEEVRQLRAAIKIYRELVERLLSERNGSG
jgi:hypothetical protein